MCQILPLDFGIAVHKPGLGLLLLERGATIAG